MLRPDLFVRFRAPPISGQFSFHQWVSGQTLYVENFLKSRQLKDTPISRHYFMHVANANGIFSLLPLQLVDAPKILAAKVEKIATCFSFYKYLPIYNGYS